MLNTYFSVLAAATANTADSQAAATSQLVSSIVMLINQTVLSLFIMFRIGICHKTVFCPIYFSGLKSLINF